MADPEVVLVLLVLVQVAAVEEGRALLVEQAAVVAPQVTVMVVEPAEVVMEALGAAEEAV